MSGHAHDEATRLAAELREALDDPQRGEWGGYPWEHLGDAERDVRVLLDGLARLSVDTPGQPEQATAESGDGTAVVAEYQGRSYCIDVWPGPRAAGVSGGTPPSVESLLDEEDYAVMNEGKDLGGDGGPVAVGTAAVTQAFFRAMRAGGVEPLHAPGPCARCGRDPATGFASIGDDWYCHGDLDAQPTCYMLGGLRGTPTGSARLPEPDLDSLVARAEAAERELETLKISVAWADADATREAKARVGLLEEALRGLRAEFERGERTAMGKQAGSLMHTAREFWRGREGAFTDALASLDAALAGVETGPGKDEQGNTGDSGAVVVEDAGPPGGSAQESGEAIREAARWTKGPYT